MTTEISIPPERVNEAKSGAAVHSSDLLAGQPVTPYYEESGIVIYCADNRRVLPHLAPCDLLLTDPPFGIGFAAQPTKWQRRAGMMTLRRQISWVMVFAGLPSRAARWPGSLKPVVRASGQRLAKNQKMWK